MKRGLAHFAWTFDKALIEISTLEEKIELGLGENEITGMEWINSGEEALFESLTDENEARAVVV